MECCLGGAGPVILCLPLGRLWYAEPDAISNAIDYAKFRSQSHDAVIRVYDAGRQRITPLTKAYETEILKQTNANSLAEALTKAKNRQFHEVTV
jgi:hypothetical protein